MRNFKIRVALSVAVALAACAALSETNCFAQGRPPNPNQTGTPAVNAPDKRALEQMSEAAFRDMLVKRLDALEAENKELKSQLSAAKLLLSGLDKGVGDFKAQFNDHKAQFNDFKAQFANHTHRIRAATGELVQVQNDSPKRPFLLYKTLDQMKSDKGFFTGPPVGQQ